MKDTTNLRRWVETWGRELTWTEHNGAKAGAISKDEMLALLDDADNSKSERQVLLGIFSTMNQVNHDLRVQLEKSARVEAVETAVNMLRACATDPGAAKNYVAIESNWDDALAPGLPFRRALIVFMRDGAKSPSQVAAEALRSRDEAIEIARDIIDRYVSPHDRRASDVREAIEDLDRLAKEPDANTIFLRKEEP